MGDHFCLKWNNHQENLTGIMTKLLDEQKFVDVSLVCEMKTFKAHQTVLSACSPYFEQVLEENSHPHPIIILRDVKEGEMTALLQYMYRGEVSVRDDELSGFLHTARALKVRGLSESRKKLQAKEEIIHNSYATQNEIASPPKRQKTVCRGVDQDVSERQQCQTDFQPPAIATTVAKTSPTPSASASEVLTSENSYEIHYSNISTHQQTIKQEVEPITASNEEQSNMSHHLQAKVEPRNELYHKMGDWNFEYGSNLENRNYQNQKGKFNCFHDPRASGTSINSCFSDTDGPEVFDGSKQWQIKYAFEKIEGSGYKCKICGQIKKHVRNHYLKHFPEHHECHLCSRTYTRKDNLNSHLKRDHFQRVKASADSCPRLRRMSKKYDDYQSLKCFTPDVYSQLKYTSSISASMFQTNNASLRAQSSPLAGPIDLSLRPNSVPVENPCSSIYGILPTFYNYFRT